MERSEGTRPRILMLLEGWHTGGTEQYVWQLARFLREKAAVEVELAVLGGGDEAHWEKARQCAAAVHRIGGPLPAALARLRRLVRQRKPDVCHLHLYARLLPVTLLLRAMRVPRLVTTLHMPLDQWSWRHRVGWQAAIRLAGHVVCNSPTVARSIGRDGSRAGKPVFVIPPPLEPLPVEAERPAGGPRSEFIVCGCGRLAREKDWPTLLRGFAALEAAADRPVRGVLIGDGPLRRELRRVAAELGCGESFRLLGRLDHAEVLAVLREADVFVLPSRFEGLGMAALEAMQCGVPTITADFAASDDFLDDGANGHRFPRGDWQKLRDVLLWHYRNPEASQALGLRGQESVLRKYSEQNTFARYLQVYNVGPEEGAAATTSHSEQGCQGTMQSGAAG